MDVSHYKLHYKYSTYPHAFSFPLIWYNNDSKVAQRSMPCYIPPVSAYQEVALYQELHPHESVCVIHPESHGCHFEGNYIIYHVFQPSQGWPWMEILLQLCGKTRNTIIWSLLNLVVTYQFWILLFLRLNCDVFSQIVLTCKVSKVCMVYFVACNNFWLLVEAVFLHTLLFTAVLTKRRLLKRYMLLGWGKAYE